MTEISSFAQAVQGRERRQAHAQLPRHRHAASYAALVLRGGYEECGSGGRYRVGPGDVLFHSMFHAHCDRFGSHGAEILNLRLPDAASTDFGAARVHDPDRVARLAENDSAAARSCLYEQLLPIPPENAGWPDMLAAELLADANLRLDLWAERQGLVPETLSRGFGALYGVTPAAFRAEARAHHAFERIVYGGQSLSDVALSLGFSDQSHMTRALTSLTGKPPRHWRKASNSFKTRQSASP